MIAYRDRVLRVTLSWGDACLAPLCLWLVLGAPALERDLYVCAGLAAALSPWALRLAGGYRSERLLSPRRSLRPLVVGCSLAAVGLLAAGAALRLSLLDVGAAAAYAPVYLIGTCIWRAAPLAWLRTAHARALGLRRVAIVGTGPSAQELVRRLAADRRTDLRVVGFFDDAPSPLDVDVLAERYRGMTKDLPEILRTEIVDEVIVSLPREHLGADSTWDALSACAAVGVDVTLLSEPFTGSRTRISCGELLGVQGLTSSSYQRRPLWALGVKRALDVGGALLGLALTLPLWIAVAIAIKVDSPGRVFFVQRRCGLHGRTFPFLKFRSMYSDAEARLAELQARNEVSGPVFKMAKDPRVTPVGRFLRRYSLDELPQLINVLIGQMSLVGPRPPLPSEVGRYELSQRRRLSVKPGLTCLWQIQGRSLIPFDEWVRLDLEYIDQWSLLLDLRILALTVPAVVRTEGAS